MAAVNNYFVRPVNGNDSTGDGLSHSTAWKTVQKALDDIVRDANDGDRINVNDEGDDVLSAALDIDGVGKYGNPITDAPLIIQGYTSTPEDGGIGGLSGGGSVAIVADNVVDSVHFKDMHLHNCGNNTVIDLDNHCVFWGCEVNNANLNGIQADSYVLVANCHFHDLGGSGVEILSGHVLHNFFKNDGTRDFSVAVYISSGSASSGIHFNVLSLDGASDGIRLADGCAIENNSIYSNGGTGQGLITFFSSSTPILVANNVVEGFSGTGGIGISLAASGKIYMYINNKYFNNATNENLLGDVDLSAGNTVLGASPFVNPAGDDFRVDTSVKAGAFPSSYKGASTNQFLDVGAAQREEAGAGGGLLVHPGMTGGLRG